LTTGNPTSRRPDDRQKKNELNDMRSWLKKFEISNALNDRKPFSPAVDQAIARSAEVRRFAENSTSLDRALRSQLPKPEASASLHASIMGAVRAARRAPAAESQPGWPRWIPVSGLALLVVLGVSLAIRFSPNAGSQAGPADSHTFAAAGSALELGGSLMREAPAAAISPLSDEMARLDRDLASTEQFLLATLP